LCSYCWRYVYCSCTQHITVTYIIAIDKKFGTFFFPCITFFVTFQYMHHVWRILPSYFWDSCSVTFSVSSHAQVIITLLFTGKSQDCNYIYTKNTPGWLLLHLS
jgi:hypothetical protein